MGILFFSFKYRHVFLFCNAGQIINEHTDEDLLVSYVDGDTEAFLALYNRHKKPLYSYIVYISRSSSNVDDLFQQIWEKIHIRSAEISILIKNDRKRGKRFNLKSYIYKMGNNLVIDHQRSLKSKTFEPYDESQNAISLPNDPSDISEAEQIAKLMMAEVDRLSDDQRRVFLLRRSGHGFEEIADIEGVGIETIRSRYRYAMKKLKHIMEKI